MFVKEIEEALLERRIDVAVHSAKDMTSTDAEGLVVGAYTPREDPRDALCGADAIRPGMRIGTASVRRRAQLLALEPSLSIEPLRGNIDTRLRKRGERGLDAVVLAACGLDRLGLFAEVGHPIRPGEMLPEAGQGALALQVRAGEEHLVGRGRRSETRRRVEAERSCVARDRRRVPRSGRGHHDGDAHGARRGRGRSLDRAAQRRRSGSARRRAARARADEGRRHRPLGQEASSLRVSRQLGHDVVHCPLIEIEPLGDEPIDVCGLRLGRRDEPERRPRARSGACGAPLPRVAAIGPRNG